MLTFGIYSKDQYLSLGRERRFLGGRVAYNLLCTGDPPEPEEVRMFEDIFVTLRISNGTFRTTFRDRFKGVDAIALKWLLRFYPPGSALRIQDRAASHGLTSAEWWESLISAYPGLDFEASDLMTELVELSDGGTTYIVEPDGKPLQYIRPPFVAALSYAESWRNPLCRWVAARAKKKFDTFPRERARRRRISCIHPSARSLEKSTPNFRFAVRSVFEATPQACDVLRTMNILNVSYFSEQELELAAAAILASIAPGGLWILGRTLEEDGANHVSILRKQPDGWDVLERIGNGSEIEALALRTTVGA